MPRTSLLLQDFQKSHHAPTASRASWIGTLRISDFIVPIKAYATIASPDTRLHQVHAGCGRRVSQQKVCSEHGKLEADQIQKAFAYAPDFLVELSEDELARLKPVDDKTIVLERFFLPNQLDLTLLAGRSLFLAAANLAARHAFAVLKAALDQKRRWALGRTVFSQKRQLVVIHSYGETVILHTLHDPAQRRQAVPAPASGSGPSRSEIRKLAKVMDDRDQPIEWMDYQDDSYERLASLVAQKVTARDADRNGKARDTKPSKSRRRSRSRSTARAA